MTATGGSGCLPVVGMLAGMLLLGFAGVIVIMPSSSVGPKQPTSTGDFLPRRLQAFGYITTSRSPSSLDSSDSSSSGSSLEPSKSFMSGSLQSSEWGMLKPNVDSNVGGAVGWITVSLMIQVIFAFLYQRVVTAPIIEGGKLDEMMTNGPEAGQTDFSNSICGCHRDPWVCFQGLFCPMVRMAHTNAVSGVCPFWESLWCYCCCAWLTLSIGPSCLLLWWRLRLKSIMRVDENPVNDFCLTLICPQISICQMSSAVDSAMGYQVTGCCEYTPYSYGGPMEQLGSLG